MDSLKYDLSGSDSKFAISLNVVAYKLQQKVKFEHPIFVKKTADGVVTSPLLYYLDRHMVRHYIQYDPEGNPESWCYTEDETAMSDAHGRWNKPSSTFPDTLVSEITLNLDLDEGEKQPLVIEAQKYCMLFSEFAEYHSGEGPAYSPSLGKYLLDKVAGMQAQLALVRAGNLFASSGAVTDFMDEDLTGTSINNRVMYERHDANTANGHFLISPARGSFYPINLKVYRFLPQDITIPASTNRDYQEIKNTLLGNIFLYSEVVNVNSSGTALSREKQVILSDSNFDELAGKTGKWINIRELTEGPMCEEMELGVDYELADLNIEKTEACSAEEGVYDHIRLISAYTGPVLICYQAFGGQVMMEDARGMRQDLTNLSAILASDKMVTTAGLENMPVIRELRARLSTMEYYLGNFHQVEHKVYMGLPGFNWFNIAQIYALDWKDFQEKLDLVDDLGTFRVESKERGWCHEFVLNTNLTRSLKNVIRTKTLGTNGNQTDTFNNYITLAQRDDVALRLCWIGDGKTSGVVLQLGWDFSKYNFDASAVMETGIDTDTIVVTNKSGSTSKWILTFDPTDVTYTDHDRIKVLNHTKYAITTDATTQTGKLYYEAEEEYVYYLTPSKYTKQGVAYFRAMTSMTSERYYVQVTLKPNTPVDSIGYDVYERQVYNIRFKAVTYSTRGQPIKPGTYEVTLADSSDTTKFVMPNDKIWFNGASGCNSVTTLLEPDDGLIAWVGNIPLAQLSPKPTEKASVITTQLLMSDVTQKIINIHQIKSATIDIYDRKEDRFFSKTITLSEGDRDELYGETVFYLEDLCGLSLKIYKARETGPQYDVELGAILGTSSVVNDRFDSRQIRLHF